MDMIGLFNYRLNYWFMGCRLLLLLVSAILLISPPLRAQEKAENNSPLLTATLDRDSEKIGGIVELRLSFNLPEGAVLDDPPQIKGLEDLTLISINRGKQEIRIKLLVDRLGSWKTGEISLDYRDREGKEGTVTTEPVSLIVLSNLGDKPEDAQLRPIQDIIPSKPFWVKNLPWLLVIIALFLAGAGIFWWAQSKKNRRRSQISLEPPHKRAITEIEQLETMKLFEKGDVKGFYFRFSEIMRRYLEDLRNFPAAEYTTEEIASRIKDEKDRILLPLLRQADLAKFAHDVPPMARKEDEIRIALSYIEETGTAFEAEDEKKYVGRRIQ